jgi:pyrroline-5-carboxylate reductase
VLSLLGPTPLADVQEAFPSSSALRAMPNVGAEVRQGVFCFAVAPGVPAELAERVRGQLQLLGRVVDLDDELFDPASVVMGCAPAFLALAMEAIAEAGAAAGLDPALSHSLIVDTAAGTAEMLRERHPADLRRAVASPGGSTEKGLAVLEQERVAEAFAAAVRASLGRMAG